MNIYVLRHGTTQWNLDHKIQGATDIPLHPIGREEARQIRRKVQDLTFEVILTSPMARALETAQIIRQNDQIPLVVESRLQEVSFGDWEGSTWDEVQQRFSFLMENIPSNGYIDPPNGESFEDAAKRICPLVKSLLKERKDCLLITHKAVIRFLVYCITKKTPAKTGGLDIPNLSILHFCIPDDGPVTWRFI